MKVNILKNKNQAGEQTKTNERTEKEGEGTKKVGVA